MASRYNLAGFLFVFFSFSFQNNSGLTFANSFFSRLPALECQLILLCPRVNIVLSAIRASSFVRARSLKITGFFPPAYYPYSLVATLSRVGFATSLELAAHTVVVLHRVALIVRTLVSLSPRCSAVSEDKKLRNRCGVTAPLVTLVFCVGRFRKRNRLTSKSNFTLANLPHVEGLVRGVSF